MAESIGELSVWDRFLYLTRPNPNNPSQTETWAILGEDLGFNMAEEAGTMYLEGAGQGRIIYFDAYQHERRVTLVDTGITIPEDMRPPGTVSIDPDAWIWYPWSLTKRATQHEDAPHGDSYPHDDAPAQNVPFHSDTPHSDHSDNPTDHSDWSDHNDVAHDDRSQHIDRPIAPHEDWSDTYSDRAHKDWSDHDDFRYSDMPPITHYNWSDSHDDDYGDHDDYADWDDVYADYNDHDDYSDYHDLGHIDYW